MEVSDNAGVGNAGVDVGICICIGIGCLCIGFLNIFRFRENMF